MGKLARIHFPGATPAVATRGRCVRCGAQGGKGAGAERAGGQGDAPVPPRTQRRRDASLHPKCLADHLPPPDNDVHMDNSCLLDLLIRCFAMTEPEDLNFTAFTDLCRLCSLKSGPRLHIFDKESEQRQILFKLRTCLPTMVSTNFKQFKILCLMSLSLFCL